MDATIKYIGDADKEHFDDAYPQPDFMGTRRFVHLEFSKSQGKLCSVTFVYDVPSCNKNVTYDVIKRSTTHYVINVDPDLVDAIAENDHLLYIDSRKAVSFFSI
jgi:hypothetical protein